MRISLGLALNRRRSGQAEPVNPAISGVTFNAGGSGSPDGVAIEGSYSGGDSLRVYAVTGTNPVTVTAEQLIAGAGGTGTLEFFNFAFAGFSASPIDVTGLTATSNSADRIALVVAEQNNGGVSGVSQVTVSGLDFTPATVSAANVNVSGNTLTITWTEAVYGSTTAAPFTLVNAARANPTLGTFSGAGTTTWTSTLTGEAIQNGDGLTLNYSPGDLTDAKGNDVAAFTGQAVTNNVSSALNFLDEFDTGDGYSLNDAVSSSANWTQVFADTGMSAIVTPVGKARISTTTNASAGTLVLEYAGVIAANHAIEVDVDSFLAGTTFRQDVTLYVGRTDDGVTSQSDSVRAFFRYTDGVILFQEFVGGVDQVTSFSPAISPYRLVAGDKVRLEKSGTTVTLKLDTGSGFTTLATMTGVGVTGGTVGFGAYCGNLNTTLRGPVLESVRVEEI